MHASHLISSHLISFSGPHHVAGVDWLGLDPVEGPGVPARAADALVGGDLRCDPGVGQLRLQPRAALPGRLRRELGHHDHLVIDPATEGLHEADVLQRQRRKQKQKVSSSSA